jgi:hypothetical protein
MWTWEKIEQEWLGGSAIAVSRNEAVDAFNRVDSALGLTWIGTRRGLSGNSFGTAFTLDVVSMGQRLAALDGISNGAGRLIKKIVGGDESASAELTAIYLVKAGRADVAIDLEPEVRVGKRHKNPDFRASVRPPTPVYVEVAHPNCSEEHQGAHQILERLTSKITDIKRGFALEMFLRRVPNEEEVASILARLPAFCILDGIQREEFGDLGFLQLNLDSPGQVEFRDYGEEYRPRIGMVKSMLGPNEPHRHIFVRLAFSDERAQRFLETEAKQLPKEVPGLIMVQVSHAPGAFRSWEPILRRRLQPNLHTRVSAICLFRSGLGPSPGGEAWIPRTKLILNTHAKHPLPDWIAQQLQRFASDW